MYIGVVTKFPVNACLELRQKEIGLPSVYTGYSRKVLRTQFCDCDFDFTMSPWKRSEKKKNRRESRDFENFKTENTKLWTMRNLLNEKSPSYYHTLSSI